MFPNNSSKNSTFQSQSVISLPVDTREYSSFSSVKLWFGEVFLKTEPLTTFVLQIGFVLCFGREHNMIRCQCKRLRNTNVMNCAISLTVFKLFAVFYFQVHSFNPFEEGKQPLCWRWTQNLSSKLKLPVSLVCQLQWQTMCPSPFLFTQFSPARQSEIIHSELFLTMCCQQRW